MRITPQQLQVKLNEVKTPTKNVSSLVAGESLQGKVLSIQVGAIVLALNNGSTLHAQVAESERFVEGETLLFKVIDSEQELVKIEIQNEASQKEQLSQIKTQLSAIDLKPTDENIKAFEVLQSLNINITKENIQILSQNFKFLTTVFEQLEQSKTEVQPEVKQEDLKMQMPGEWVGKTPEVVKEPVEKMALQTISEQLGFENEEKLKNADLKEVVVRLLQKSTDETITLPKLNSEQLRTALGLVEKLTSNQLDLNDTMEKMGQLMKLEKPINFKNISILDKLNFESTKINSQVDVLLKELDPKTVSPKLLSLLNGIKVQDFKNDSEVKKYFNTLVEALSDLKESASSRVKSHAEQLIHSVKFLEKEQNNINWIQVPIQWQEKSKSLDIYVKSDKKESRVISKDNAKILIALNTNYLKEVQALIHVDKSILNIHFTVENEKTLKLFNKSIHELSSQLEALFNTIKIDVKSGQPMAFSDFVDSGQTHTINLKV